MFQMKRLTVAMIRAICLAALLANVLVPVPAQARSITPPEEGARLGAAGSVPRRLAPQAAVYYQPPNLPQPRPTTQEGDEPQPKVPPRAEAGEIEFLLSASPAVLRPGESAVLRVTLRNHSEDDLFLLDFKDQLEGDLEYVPNSKSPVSFNKRKNEVSYTLPRLAAGEEFSFEYTLRIAKNGSAYTRGEVWVHAVELKEKLGGLALKAQATLGFDLETRLEGGHLSLIDPDGAWNDAGEVSVYVPKEAAQPNTLLVVAPTRVQGKGPAMQFNLEMARSGSIARQAGGLPAEQQAAIQGQGLAAFKSPVYLQVNLDSVADLRHIPAGQEPFVATYDEKNQVWVKMPILEADLQANTVTVETTHFSTWGAGLGESLPQNGAGALLFEQPYTSLFTGAAQYSLAIETPPGRAGMAPQVSLSYSSATLDGVLGDVQGSPVGAGWNMDDIEVVRRITTNEDGYGYINHFALTLNGALYDLTEDTVNTGRYYTLHDAFLYIERHNYAFGNMKDGDLFPPNTSGEWWEVITQDGTHYRLGWNPDAEQLAPMIGYACSAGGLGCLTPDGPYATLGYAGVAEDLVVRRWRVDRITDTHGNFITYSYTESQPDPSTWVPAYDRESYLGDISYTGFEHPGGQGQYDLEPGYQVHFEYEERTGDVPDAFNIWDYVDFLFLDRIEICLGMCGETGSTLVRTYDLDYTVEEAPNENGTLTLSGLEISGGGYQENGQTVPFVETPSMTFTYENKPNRQVIGSSMKEFSYPRLVSIQNGFGGKIAYTYETDGRGIYSWYNYRVTEVEVESEAGNTAALYTYTYEDPVYKEPGYSGWGIGPDDGSLVGYTTVSEEQLDFDHDNDVLSHTRHTFGAEEPDIGHEFLTEWLAGEEVLRKTAYTYVTDSSQAPFPGWYFRYLSQTANYERSGASLPLVSKSASTRDPGTGNLLAQADYIGSSLYRKTYYEYLTNPDPDIYLMDKASRVLLVNASNQVVADTRYHYDNRIGLAPDKGDLTLVQNLTGSGSQTVDASSSYDVYGNVTSTRNHTSYGAVNAPSGAYTTTSTEYDDSLWTYPLSATDPLGQVSTTEYLFGLGLPYAATDPNGWATATEYDGLGRTLSVTPPGLGQPGVWYTYPTPLDGQVAAPYAVEMQILDSAAGVYRSVWGMYDGLGRMLQTQVYDADQGQLLVTDTQFNAQGLAYRQSSPYYESGVGGAMQGSAAAGEYTQSAYDSFGRVTELSQPAYNFSPTEPVYNITQTSYSGLTTTVIDPNGNRVSRTTDGLGRMKYVLEYQDAPGIYATTQYFYDAADRLIQVTDAEGNYTTLQYDWLGRKTGMDDMDMGVWSYAYDPSGNLLLQTDARGQSLAFQYDALNRLVEKRDASQEIVLSTYTYGAAQGVIGFRTAMNDQGGSTTWSYADFGRTVTETRAAGSMITASDWLGRPLQATYPGGESLTYSYDALGRPEQLASDQTPGAPLAGLSYNQLGQVTTQALGNNLAVSNTYESYTHRLSNRQALAGQTSLLDMDYTYEANGNIASITDNALGETHVYQYDSLNRLTLAEATQSGSYVYRQQFVYDKIGNIQGADDWDVISYPNPITQTEPGPQKGVHLASLSMPWPFFQLEQTETPTPTPTPTNTLIPTNTGAPTYTVSPTETSATSTPTKTPTASRTPTTTPSMEQSLAAHWDFNNVTGDTVQDIAPQDNYNNVAYLENDPAIIPAGADGDALRLDGDNDYAWVPHQGELNSSESFTLSAWVNPAAIITDRIQYIVHKGETADDYGFITTSNNGTATPTPDGTATPPVYLPSNGGLAFIVGDLSPDRILGPVLPVDTWTLVTGVYDKPAKRLHLYLNGALAATQEVTGAVSMSVGGLYFSATDHLFNGSLDEVRFYRRALSAAEVQQLMGEFPTPTPPASQTPTPATLTAVPTSTPIPVGAYPWGNGADGDLTVAANDPSFNIHTDGSNGRNCADAVAFSVISLGSTAALLNASPAGGCLSPNDEVLLAHLNGESLTADNIGNYEFLRVASVDTSTVTFSTPKTKWYGNDYRSDAGIGVETGQNRVMLMRVPNYEDVTINGALTGEAFDNLKYGLLAFRASGTLSGSGTIHMDEKGFKGTAVVGDLRGYGAGGNGQGTADGNSGGGGGYGTPGAQGDGEHGGAGGQAYGAPQLETLFFGSGGGAGYSLSGGMRGGDGGGVIFVAGQTINFSGSLSAQGMDGPGTALKGGGGAGGSILIQGYDVSLNTIEATGGDVAGENGHGGVGRVAVYYQNSKAYTSSAPAAFEGLLGQAPTLTPSPTSISLTPAPAWGSGLDGDLTVASGEFNLHTQASNWRTCADGVSYKVIDLGDDWAKLSEAPGAGCLAAGDEVLLNHLYGSGPNIGNYEFLRVGQVSEDIVYFTTPKANFYGDEADSDIGVSSDTQKVALYRVPNYNDVAIDGALTGQAFDNQKNGLLVFRVAGTLSGSGTIHMDEKGYKGYAVVGDIRGYGAGGNGSNGNGGGGGYGTPGAQGAGAQGGAGGQAYGVPQLEAPFLGSGGGAGYNQYGGMRGSDGGGAIFIVGQTINFSGNLSAKGMNSLEATLKGGGGSGGSILVQGQDVSLYTATVDGGSYSESFGKGGKGRIAVYYQDTFSSNFPPDYLQKADTPDTISNSDFETGDLSQWDSALTDDGDLSASGDDAYWGRYALRAALDDANDLYVQDDSPEEETRYRARFYLHPGDLGLQAGETLDLLAGYDDATQVLRVQVRQYGSLYQVRAGLLDDAAAWSDTAWHTTQDSWTALEIDWQARAGEGSVSLYIGGILRESLTQVDNDTRALTQARLGAMQIGTGASGSLYLDDFDARRFSSIGLLPDPGLDPASGAPGLLTNLVGWWSLDEDSGLRVDAHGDNHLGDYNTVEDTTGIQGQAADFEMNNHEYLYHDDAPDFDLSDVEWSIAAWVKLEGQVVGSVHSILRKFDAGGSQKEYLLAVSGTDRKARIYVSGNGATGANLASSVVLASPAQQKWQFIVAWYDGSNLYIQVDDNPVDTLAYTGGIYDGNSMFLVGGDPYDGQRFDGAIDEVALYKRVLSDEERAWLYNAGLGRSYAELLGEQPPSEGWMQRGYAYEGQQPHAVTSVSHSGGADTYEYDQNGNMTCRQESGAWFVQTYNAENRIASIRELAEGDCETPVKIATQWDYAYDGDGVRTATLTTPYDENGNPQTASLTTYYFGGAYEVTDGAVKKYYAFGGATVAMRDGNGLQYFLTDHLGSVLAVTDASGALTSEQRYLPFGQVRDDVGTITQTDFGYTFQRGNSYIKLLDYKARWYHPGLGRFVSPDPIVPDQTNPQSQNRYSYVYNRPIILNDPSGHFPWLLVPIIIVGAFLLSSDMQQPPDPAIQAIENIRNSSPTAADALVRMFTTEDLPGNSPEERLDVVLDATQDLPFGHFRIDFDDSGFKENLRDPWPEDSGNQVGHFLSAVDIGYNQDNSFGRSAIVGHEMYRDDRPWSIPTQLILGEFNPSARKLFTLGTDDSFDQILNKGCGPTETRTGNSKQDLQLSYLGWMMGRLFRQDYFTDNASVGKWLRKNLVE